MIRVPAWLRWLSGASFVAAICFAMCLVAGWLSAEDRIVPGIPNRWISPNLSESPAAGKPVEARTQPAEAGNGAAKATPVSFTPRPTANGPKSPSPWKVFVDWIASPWVWSSIIAALFGGTGIVWFFRRRRDSEPAVAILAFEAARETLQQESRQAARLQSRRRAA